MGAEIRTNLVVSMQAQGFEQIQQRLTGMVGAAEKAAEKQAQGLKVAEGHLAKFQRTGEKMFSEFQGNLEDLSTKQFQSEINTLQDRLKELGKEQLATMRVLEKVDEGSEGFKKLSDYLKDINEDSTKVQRTMQAMTRALKEQARTAEDAQKASGSFTQGLLQGALPQGFIQRGPGAMRQAGGVMAGRAARGVGGGVASTPFTGAQGLSQAISSIPGGGILAGQFNASMGYVQSGMQAQEARRGMIPYMQGGLGDQSRRRARGGYIESERDPQALRKRLSQYRRDPESFTGADREDIEADIEGIRTAGQKSIARSKRRLMKPIRAAGADILGVGEVEATQRAGSILQAGGGSMAELQKTGMMRSGFAAMGRYGADAGSVGSFFQAGRAGGGGLVGAQGRPAEAMTEAIGDALAMGLGESEIPQYLQQMAAGIQQWAQTGMPINATSIGRMGKAVSGMGLGGIRGSAIAQGMHQAGQRISQTGVQSATDMLMMQSMTGFTGEGGLEEYEQSMLDLEQGKTKEGGAQSMFKSLMAAGGGGAGGRLTFQRAMKQQGVGVSLQETRLLDKQMRGEDLSKEEKKYVAGVEKKIKEGVGAAPKTPEQMIKSAQEATNLWAGDLKRYNKIQNDQIDIGIRLAPVMNDLERGTKTAAKAFTTIAEGPLKDFSEITKEVSGDILEISKTLKAMQKEKGFFASLLDMGG